jgi:hypothetical protein
VNFDCPVEGCDRSHSIEHVTCGPCWRRVPRDIQKRVYATWHSRRRYPNDERVVAEHEAAKDAAIAFVSKLYAEGRGGR